MLFVLFQANRVQICDNFDNQRNVHIGRQAKVTVSLRIDGTPEHDSPQDVPCQTEEHIDQSNQSNTPNCEHGDFFDEHQHQDAGHRP